jgi:mannan endo-1,4-beta-mannosidase
MKRYNCFFLISAILLIALHLPCFSGQLFAQGVKYEAENATLQGVTIAKSTPGFSGTGYVTGFDNDNDQVIFNINQENQGKYELLIGYASPNGDKNNYVIVNEETLGNLLFPSSNSFKEISAGNIFLEKGANSISVVKSWGWFNVDYIRISEAQPSASWNISPNPVNSNVTPEALGMYRYLLHNFGKTTFAGQFQAEDKLYTDNDSEIDYIFNLTGKYPAVYGNDLIDYSPTRIQHGSTSKASADIVNWFKNEGGMVTLTWHWNAPTDLYNTSEQPWWSGFYTRATSFDIAWVMNNPQSEKYSLLLRDIDAIADQLKIYQEEKIPILWRPLHESEGAWFWWGAKGPQACVKLWKLLYDRLTNYHKINNLIWVWTTTDSPAALSWYPGDEFVDILGADIYLEDGDYSVSSTLFDNLRGIFQGKKMITMSENGTIPDPGKMVKNEAQWLYNCTWVGDFIFDGKKNSKDHINYYFNHDKVTTLDEMAENWMNFTNASEIKKKNNPLIYPNPSNDQLNFDFNKSTLPKRISVFNQSGQLVSEWKEDKIENKFTVNVDHLQTGIYIVTILTDRSVKTYKIVKK